MYDFISYTRFNDLNTHLHYQELSIAISAIAAKDGLFLVLWRHIHRLLLHVQIAAKAVSSSE